MSRALRYGKRIERVRSVGGASREKGGSESKRRNRFLGIVSIEPISISDVLNDLCFSVNYFIRQGKMEEAMDSVIEYCYFVYGLVQRIMCYRYTRVGWFPIDRECCSVETSEMVRSSKFNLSTIVPACFSQ